MSKKFVRNTLMNWIDELNENETEPHSLTTKKMFEEWKGIFDKSLANEFNIEIQDLSFKEYTRLVNEGYDEAEALKMADKNVFLQAMNTAIENARKELNYIFRATLGYEKWHKQKQTEE